MNELQVLQPVLAGLSLGAFCVTSCVPFLGSVLAAENRPSRQNALEILKFLTGRFAGYLCIGILAGYLGEHFDSRWLRLATGLSLIVLSVILGYYLIGIFRREQVFCSPEPQGSLRHPSLFLMGFLLGINLCPPFLLSVTYVLSQHSALYGVVYFALFFLSSSVYFAPLIFVGLLARAYVFRTAARWSGFLISGIFLIYGIYSVFHTI
ncbi:MAG: sulfite exporter TauE/SafE family protein [Candidatus Omnitrophica bacterium]|nr:sulfite exporter TauE/SafE family protein [Candidatus Omnitrophota bacterium]